MKLLAIKLNEGIQIYDFDNMPDRIKELRNVGNLRAKNEMQLFELGFRRVILPPKLDNQEYILDLTEQEFNETKQVYIAKVKELPTKTSEEIKAEEIAKTKQLYEKHRNAGWNEYQNFRAEIVFDIAQGTISEMQAFEIESVLCVGYDRISNTGDWKTALFLLNQIELNEAQVFIQPYLSNAIASIYAYIVSNYEVHNLQNN